MEHMIHENCHLDLNSCTFAAPNIEGTIRDHHHNQIMLREAALCKFRLKREKRSFQKKIRYPKMKKIADQRQRVRGQFVRESVPKSDDQSNSLGIRLEVAVQTNQAPEGFQIKGTWKFGGVLQAKGVWVQIHLVTGSRPPIQ